MVKFAEYQFLVVIVSILSSGCSPKEDLLIHHDIGKGAELIIPFQWEVSQVAGPVKNGEIETSYSFELGEREIVIQKGIIWMRQSPESNWENYGKVILGYRFELNVDGKLTRDGVNIEPVAGGDTLSLGEGK